MTPSSTSGSRGSRLAAVQAVLFLAAHLHPARRQPRGCRRRRSADREPRTGDAGRGRLRVVRRSLRPAIDARPSQRRARVPPRRVSVAVGHSRPRRLALLRRIRRGRGLRQPQSIDGAGSRGVEGHRGALARLAARPRRRVRLHDRARQARHVSRSTCLRRCTRSDRRAGWTRCSTRSPARGVAVDLRPAVEAAKARERVYHLTDSHWNARGALVAYQQIVEAVRAQDPAVPPAWKRSDFEEVERQTGGLDLARMMGLNHVLQRDGSHARPEAAPAGEGRRSAGRRRSAELGRIVTAIPGSHLPRAVVFRDSFTTALVPFLAEHFSRAVFLWQKDFIPEQVVTEGGGRRDLRDRRPSLVQLRRVAQFDR